MALVKKCVFKAKSKARVAITRHTAQVDKMASAGMTAFITLAIAALHPLEPKQNIFPAEG